MFWTLWVTLSEEEFSWAMYEICNILYVHTKNDASYLFPQKEHNNAN